jgi:hypothetical protein
VLTGVAAFTAVLDTVAVTAGVVAVTAGVVAVTAGVVAVTAGVVAVTAGVVAVTPGVVAVTAGTVAVTPGMLVGTVTVSPSGDVVANTFAANKPEIAPHPRSTTIVHFTAPTQPSRSPVPPCALPPL